MITDNNKKWHYLFVRNLSALFRRITSNHNGDFYCLNCFHSLSINKKLENACKDHDYYYIKMPNENKKILKDNPGEKCMRVSFIIYVDKESILEKKIVLVIKILMNHQQLK